MINGAVTVNFSFLLTGFMKFSFSQLVDATNNFSTENKIGLGGFSIVYKVVNMLPFQYLAFWKLEFQKRNTLDFLNDRIISFLVHGTFHNFP